VSSPLISVTKARIKEGRLEDFKQFVKKLVENLEAREPQLIAYNVFLNEDGTEMTSIQVHPNAASMDSHMKVLDHVLGEKMEEWVERADFLEIRQIEIYGPPSDALLEADQQRVDSGALTRILKPSHVAGFTRSTNE
jgi:quinol monooxygenase YgiN